ncbi:hypothetical protein OAT93_01595 [bacterium]|nr:hypothetical protein [bacterium]
MKDKILDIVAEHCVGWKNCEALTEKLFDLYSVSQQRELLIAFAKYMEEDKMYARHDEANVDDFLDNHSN